MPDLKQLRWMEWTDIKIEEPGCSLQLGFKNYAIAPRECDFVSVQIIQDSTS